MRINEAFVNANRLFTEQQQRQQQQQQQTTIIVQEKPTNTEFPNFIHMTASNSNPNEDILIRNFSFTVVDKSNIKLLSISDFSLN